MKYGWIKLPSGYKYTDEDLQKFKMFFKNHEIEQGMNVCKQLLKDGLIQPTGNKIQEIFNKAANFSLEINREKPEHASKSTTKKKKKKWSDTPILKAGDKESYRGLSIMNTLLKLVGNMTSKRLQRYLTEIIYDGTGVVWLQTKCKKI